MSEIFGQSCIIKNQQAKAEDHITFVLQGNTNLPLYLAAMHKIWRYYRFVHTEIYEKNGKHINFLFCFVLMTQICRKAVFCTLKDADQFFYFPTKQFWTTSEMFTIMFCKCNFEITVHCEI